jgi:molecular chaperone GrpE (heat shock protein)
MEECEQNKISEIVQESDEVCSINAIEPSPEYSQLLIKIARLSDRDAIIRKLHARLAIFEEDLKYRSIKTVLKSLIDYHKDINKSLRNLENNQNKKDRANDYKLYVSALLQLLKTNGLKLADNDGWLFNGIPVENSELNARKTYNANDIEIIDRNSDRLEEKIDGLIEIDKSIFQDAIMENERLFYLLTSEYKKSLLLSIAEFYRDNRKIQETVSELSEEKCVEFFGDLADGIKKILSDNGVSFSVLEGENYNEDIQTLLETVDTADRDLDTKIAFRYSPTYKYGEKTIERETVDVYKFKE